MLPVARDVLHRPVPPQPRRALEQLPRRAATASWTARDAAGLAQRAGYRTIHIGKYLNEYGERDPREVPPGWDDWYGGVDPTTYDYYGMTINHNGTLQTYARGRADYSTDVYAGLAERRSGPATRRASRSS